MENVIALYPGLLSLSGSLRNLIQGLGLSEFGRVEMPARRSLLSSFLACTWQELGIDKTTHCTNCRWTNHATKQG